VKDQLTAADVINYMSVDGLCKVIKKYGEERHAKLIAHAIVDSRYAFGPITTTAQLASIVTAACNGFGTFLPFLYIQIMLHSYKFAAISWKARRLAYKKSINWDYPLKSERVRRV